MLARTAYSALQHQLPLRHHPFNSNHSQGTVCLCILVSNDGCTSRIHGVSVSAQVSYLFSSMLKYGLFLPCDENVRSDLSIDMGRSPAAGTTLHARYVEHLHVVTAEMPTTHTFNHFLARRWVN